MKKDYYAYETALLGQVLNIPSIIEEHSISAELFEDRNYRTIFEAVQRARNKGLKPDLLTIGEELRTVGREDLAVALAGIEPLSAANAQFYTEQLRERLRSYNLSLSLSYAKELLERGEPTLSVVENLFTSATAAMQAAPETVDNSASRLIQDYGQALQAKIKARKERSLIEIGFGVRALDAFSGAIHPGEIVIIAARPGTGKTSLALQTAMHCAGTLRLPSAFFSFEMLKNEVLDRLLAQKGAAMLRDIRDGRVDIDSIYTAMVELGELPLSIYDGRHDLGLLRARLRREKALHNLQVAFLDYIGLIDAGMMGNAPRWERIAEISRSLKLLALELKIAIFIVAQLNRDADGTEPTLGNLRDSGSLEQDADRVLLLYRPNSSGDDSRIIAHLAKNRHGRTGRLDLNFSGENVRFS
ncbi:MAG: Replicative DNA helicase [Spirochaetes bacterium ADurb.Bin110]|jgi:replicative DNA helicase|nr:MAG: Replicative DNA helicase [Spirochaetes bacterium ADurb.Bin110]